MKSRFTLIWDEALLALAFRVTVEDVREYMTDGRRVSFIIERRLAWENKGWALAPSEGAGYDLRDPEGGLWEVRSIGRGGVYFTPSNQVGSGRSYEEEGFLAKLGLVKGFILADITEFPVVECYRLESSLVRRWHREGKLGPSARISRAAFQALQKDIPRG
ncbi:MAG TPA: hypothetical protein VD970_10540 [Acetobacteraceae bacterium]|nr:hypothetical protein [Acetobacteraceae bacterium]